MGHSVELFTQQPPNPDIVCSICTDVVKDARTACEEGHVFCEPCITHPRSTANGCPTCRGAIQLARSRTIDNLVGALEVRVKARSGCRSVLPRSGSTPDLRSELVAALWKRQRDRTLRCVRSFRRHL